MNLELPYYSDKVITLNPIGHVGILTLWSKTDTVLQRLKNTGGIRPCVAAISNYYGDGISQLLANLLYNPQICKIFAVGNNRTGSLQELIAFFDAGINQVQINGTPQCRIAGTTRLVNSAITGPEMFRGHAPRIVSFTDGSLDDQIQRLQEALAAEVPAVHQMGLERAPVIDRVEVKLIDPVINIFPSVQAGHQVIADSPLDAWAEALFTIQRFGLPVTLAKGERKEIINLKVVITNPTWQTDDEYRKYNLDKTKLKAYCVAMMEPTLGGDTSYTYGNRVCEYFGYNMVAEAIRRLTIDKEDRKCYLALWDARNDMYDDNPDGSHRGHPCWVGGFFRVFDGHLTLSVTFRTHRAYTAFIENVHGLIDLQTMVASEIGLPVGPLTVVSHSISIDPGQLPMVDSIVNGRKWKLRDDGRGTLTFDIKDGKALVEHRMGSIVLKRYESANVEALSHQLAQDMVVSDLNHSLYVGKMLGKLQMCLKHGLPFEES